MKLLLVDDEEEVIEAIVKKEKYLLGADRYY